MTTDVIPTSPVSYTSRVLAVIAGVAVVWASLAFATGWVALLATLLIAGTAWHRTRRAPEGLCSAFLLIGAGLAWLPVLALLLLSPSVGAEVFPLPFNETAWRSGSLRLHMVDSLVESERLEGLSRAEVHSLLGEPSDHFETEDYYLLGHAGTFAIDNTYLVVDYTAAGRAYSAATMDS